MARSRNIKPGFFTNDMLAEIEPLGRLLFAGLWTIADREGRLQDRPKKIKAEVLPFDDCDVDKLLTELSRLGFIQRYVVEGVSYIQVSAWKKHQNPHVKESASTIPAPCKHSADTIPAPCKGQPLPERAVLIPDSLNLIPDSSVASPVCAADSVLRSESDARTPDNTDQPDESPEQTQARIVSDANRQRPSPITPFVTAFRMTLEWLPDEETLRAHCLAAGVSPDIVTQPVLAEFRAYRSERVETFTERQWIAKLVSCAQRAPAPRKPTESHSDYVARITDKSWADDFLGKHTDQEWRKGL